jgi:hypothetical protein
MARCRTSARGGSRPACGEVSPGRTHGPPPTTARRAPGPRRRTGSRPARRPARARGARAGTSPGRACPRRDVRISGTSSIASRRAGSPRAAFRTARRAPDRSTAAPACRASPRPTPGGCTRRGVRAGQDRTASGTGCRRRAAGESPPRPGCRTGSGARRRGCRAGRRPSCGATTSDRLGGLSISCRGSALAAATLPHSVSYQRSGAAGRGCRLRAARPPGRQHQQRGHRAHVEQPSRA